MHEITVQGVYLQHKENVSGGQVLVDRFCIYLTLLILIDYSTVTSYFSIGTVFDIQCSHLHHSLLEIEEEHGLVHGVAIDEASSAGGGIQGLIGEEKAVPPHHGVEVIVVE